MLTKIEGRLSSSVVAFFLLTLAQVSLAEEDITEIIVSSDFKKGIMSAMQQKRASDRQIDALGFEDIGVLPGASIAESIARLPGLSAVRDNVGRPSFLTVRGSDNLTMGTLNGREQVTSDRDGTRNVEYNLYPSEVMSAVQVYKTQSAEMTEGGLMGTINMDTVKPLDLDERRFILKGSLSNFEIAGDTGSKSDDFGGDISVSFIDQVNENLGYALGFTAVDGASGHLRTSNGGYGTFDAGGFGSNPLPDVDGDGEAGEERIINQLGHASRAGTEDRQSVFVALQYKVGDFDINFDHLQSKRSRDHFNSGLFFQGMNQASQEDIDNGRVSNISITSIDGVDYLTGATVQRVGARTQQGFGGNGFYSYNQADDKEAETATTGLNVSWSNDTLTVNGDIFRSEASDDYYVTNTTLWRYASNPAQTEGFGCPCPESAPDFSVTYNMVNDTVSWGADADLTDPATFAHRQFSEQYFFSTDELNGGSLSAALEVDSGTINLVKFGIRYADREKVFEVPYDLNSTGVIPVTNNEMVTSAQVDDVISGNGGPAYLTIDPFNQSVLSLYTDREKWTPGDCCSGNEVIRYNSPRENSGSVMEETTSAFIQIDFDTEFGATPVSGNFGVRYFETDVEAPGWQAPGDRNSTLVERTLVTHSYNDVLPSLNLNFGLTEDHVVRVGVAEVIARAPLDYLKSTERVSVGGFGGNTVEASGGNPRLNPTSALQSSISLEWYASDSQTFSIAAFYNDFETFIGDEILTGEITLAGVDAVPESVDGFGNVTPAQDAVPAQTVPYARTTQNNMDGGYLSGIELRAFSTFGFVNPALENAGIDFTISSLDSNVRPMVLGGFGSSGLASGMSGLSDTIYNLTAFYAQDKFEARINVNYRSSFVFAAGLGGFQDYDEATIVDAEASYDILDNLKVSVFGANLTDEPQRIYDDGIPALTIQMQHYGSTFGVRLKYDLD